MTRLTTLIFAVAVSLALPLAGALANSSNPKCGAFDCTTTSYHGGSTNTCTSDNPGCTTTDTKQNPAGNNKTSDCSGPDSQCTK